MKRDGVVNAKAEIFTDTFGFHEIPAAADVGADATFAAIDGSMPFNAIHKARRSGKLDARDLIALGTLMPSDSRRQEGVRLGIFVQRPRLRQHPIVERALSMVKGEADIIVTGPIRRQAAARAGRYRPLEVGVSVGHDRISAGTLGCFAKRRSDGRCGFLSNNHVLAFSNRGRAGDIIVQPGRLDGGQPRVSGDCVAELSDFVPLRFGVNDINYVDAAFAVMVDGVDCSRCEVRHHGTAWKLSEGNPLTFENQTVLKMGRTTGATRGTVEAVDIDNLLVTYRFGQSFGIARFDKQISIIGEKGSFSRPGDSGSLICATDGIPLALLFAGSERGGRDGRGLTFASPIESVLDALDVDLWLDA